MRVNRRLTIASGTPINLATGKGAAFPYPVYARAVCIGMGSTGIAAGGLGYVMDGIYNRVPSFNNPGDVTMELFPAAQLTPGGIYSDFDDSRERGIDVNAIWIDGAQTGDFVRASYDQIV